MNWPEQCKVTKYGGAPLDIFFEHVFFFPFQHLKTLRRIYARTVISNSDGGSSTDAAYWPSFGAGARFKNYLTVKKNFYIHSVSSFYCHRRCCPDIVTRRNPFTISVGRALMPPRQCVQRSSGCRSPIIFSMLFYYVSFVVVLFYCRSRSRHRRPHSFCFTTIWNCLLLVWILRINFTTRTSSASVTLLLLLPILLYVGGLFVENSLQPPKTISQEETNLKGYGCRPIRKKNILRYISSSLKKKIKI